MALSLILTIQVAQLWQRDHAQLDTFTINIQHYLQNHKSEFLGHPMGAVGAIQAFYLKVLTQRNVIAEFRRENASFTRKTAS